MHFSRLYNGVLSSNIIDNAFISYLASLHCIFSWKGSHRFCAPGSPMTRTASLYVLPPLGILHRTSIRIIPYLEDSQSLGWAIVDMTGMTAAGWRVHPTRTNFKNTLTADQLMDSLLSQRLLSRDNNIQQLYLCL